MATITRSLNCSDRLYGRIKRGATICQDHHFFRWPNCHAKDGSKTEADPDMIFEVKWEYESWDCRADGYGMRDGEGDYGSGAIWVTMQDGVEIVKEPRARGDKQLGDYAAYWMIPYRMSAWWCDRYEPIGDEL
jgi:hypothetical protein